MNWIVKKLKQGGLYTVVAATYVAVVMILAALVLLAMINSARGDDGRYCGPPFSDTGACVNEIVN